VVPALSAVAIARVFEAGRRGPAFGLLAAGTGAAQAAGPVVGGVLGEVAGWRSLFWVSTALVVPVLIGAARTLGAADHPAATPGAELSPESAFRVASFAGACGVGLLALLTYLAVEILIPLQVAELNGIGELATGIVLLPGALITVALSRAAGHWSDRRGDRRVAVVGAAVMAVAAGGLSTVAGSSPVLVGAGMLVLGLGFALVVVSAVNAAARALPPARMGVGLGIYQSAFYVGGALGALLSTASLTARSPPRQHGTRYITERAPPTPTRSSSAQWSRSPLPSSRPPRSPQGQHPGNPRHRKTVGKREELADQPGGAARGTMRCSPSPPSPSVARSSTPPWPGSGSRPPSPTSSPPSPARRTAVWTPCSTTPSPTTSPPTPPPNRPAPTAPGPGHDNFVSV